MFFGHPWVDPDLPSLLAIEDGTVLGSLGVVPRPFVRAGRELRVAVGHHFMVRPTGRATPAAMLLLRRFLHGPQDLSLAEGNDATRTLWQAMGGRTLAAQSLRFTLPLRPTGLAVAALRRRRGGRLPAAVLAGPARLADRLLPTRLQPSRAVAPPVDLVAEPLDSETLDRGLEAVAGSALRPRYAPGTLERALELRALAPGAGEADAAAISRRNRPIGWYVVDPEVRPTASLLQLGAAEGQVDAVLDHLLATLRESGAPGLSGALDPRLLGPLSRRGAFFGRRGATWLLVHGKAAGEIAGEIALGDAFLAHLEGEWWA